MSRRHRAGVSGVRGGKGRYPFAQCLRSDPFRARRRGMLTPSGLSKGPAFPFLLTLDGSPTSPADFAQKHRPSLANPRIVLIINVLDKTHVENPGNSGTQGCGVSGDLRSLRKHEIPFLIFDGNVFPFFLFHGYHRYCSVVSYRIFVVRRNRDPLTTRMTALRTKGGYIEC
jgi:hypothetical protein